MTFLQGTRGNAGRDVKSATLGTFSLTATLMQFGGAIALKHSAFRRPDQNRFDANVLA
jgi:hypothetical protein